MIMIYTYGEDVDFPVRIDYLETVVDFQTHRKALLGEKTLCADS